MLSMQKIHAILGYLGLIPFIGLAGLHLYGWPMAEMILLSYSVMILSFLGGVVWMASLNFHAHWSQAVVSNLAMLLGWAALLLHSFPGVLYLVSALFALLVIYEFFTFKDQYPSEFMALRMRLTIVACVSMLVVAYS